MPYRSFYHGPVTLYRLEGEQVTRQVLERAGLSWRNRRKTNAEGIRENREFLLVLNADDVPLQVGDRIFDGIGPEISREQWSTFLPVTVEGLAQVGSVCPVWWRGELHHVEATD